MIQARQRSSVSPVVSPVVRASRALLALVFGLAMLAPTLNASAPAAAQASTVSFRTAEAAPADSFAYAVTTTDDQSEQWRLADVLIDRAGFGEALDEALAEELTDESGEDLPLDAFLGGEVGVVVSATVLDTIAAESMGGAEFNEMMGAMGMATPEAAAADPDGEGFVVVVNARAPDTAWTGIRDSMREDSTEETTYEGTEIFYTPPSDDEDEGTAIARVGDLILLGVAAVDLHPVIDTAEGRTPAITTLPEFTTAREALTGEYLMFSFANNQAVMESDLGTFAMAAGELSGEAFSATTVAATEPGFRIESVALPLDGETLPAGAANFDSELIGLAPTDTLFFASGADLGATGVLDAMGATALAFAFGMTGADAMPEEGASTEEFIAEQYEAAASLIGINLQTELFQQFTGEYGAWLAADAASQQVSGLFATGAADPEAVGNALMQLSFLIQGAAGAESPLTTREIDGGQVFVIDLGDEAGSTFEFGVVGDRVVLGSGTAVDRLAGDPEESLADNTLFQAVMDTLPVERNGLTYIDLERAIPLFQTAAAETDDLGLGGFEEFPDASESCANYASQKEAQVAYDAAEPDTFDLDQDFDGEVCEDFFATAEEPDEGSDATMLGADSEEAAEIFEDIDYSAVKAYGMASFDEGGFHRTSAILYISE